MNNEVFYIEDLIPLIEKVFGNRVLYIRLYELSVKKNYIYFSCCFKQHLCITCEIPGYIAPGLKIQHGNKSSNYAIFAACLNYYPNLKLSYILTNQ